MLGVSRLRLAVAVASVATGIAAPPPLAAAASGHFRFGERRLEVRHAYAFLVEAATDPARRETILLLTGQPIDAAAAGLALAPGAAALAELAAGGGGLVQVTIGVDGEASLFYFDTASSAGLEAADVGELRLTARGPQRVAGNWILSEPQVSSGETFDFALEFDAVVSDAPVRGEPLGADGGAPGEAYLAHARALREGDVAALRRQLGARAAESLPPEADPATLGMILSWLRAGRPLEPRILGGLLRGDTAILRVEGVDDEGSLLRGRVLMVREAEAWREADSDLAPADAD